MDSIRKIQVKFNKMRVQLRKRPREEVLTLEVNGLEALIRDELIRHSGPITEIPLPSRAVTDLDLCEIPRIFELTPDKLQQWEFQPGGKERITTPAAYVSTLHSDYKLAMGASESMVSMSLACIDAIILTTLARVKQNAVANSKLSASSIRSIRSLHIQHQTKLSMPWELPDGPHRLSGIIDWSVWYEQLGGCLETNCIIVEAKNPLESGKAVQRCLAYMGMVYSARKKAGLRETDVWGIATGLFCHFLHIRSDGTYVHVPYDWTNSSDLIPVMIAKMYCSAAKAGELPTQNKRWTAASGARFEKISEYEESTNWEEDF